MDGKRSDSVESLPESLTKREIEILICLADGLSNHEIANKLFLAEQTVRVYSSQIYSKLDVRNRRSAVKRAQELGLLLKASSAPALANKHNLLTQATLFIGRQHELVELTHLLADENTRLITILAPGGMGKTRLALQAARLQIGRYPDGVIFVPLAPLSSPSDIVTIIAENIGFSFYGEKIPAQQLSDFLRDRSILLVLDNFEHLLDGAQLVADLLQVASNVQIMITSRERLNLYGETVYILRGLDFPTLQTPDDALRFDAVKLFLQSARRIRSDFELHAHDLDHMTRICRLTAGLPLGIELAAGWVDVLSLEQIAAEIQRGISILETDMRDVPERHRSIRATFDRTWVRLTDDERGAFMRLSIFRGGFTVQAAQEVAGADVRSLRQLSNKALVYVSHDNRHDIHELLRQFGAEKLMSSGEHPSIQAKHTVFFVDFMQRQGGKIASRQQFDALDQIGADFENVRLAWNVLVDQHAFNELPKIVNGLRFFLHIRNRWQEGVELFETAANTLQSIPSSDASQLTLARLWARLAWFYSFIGFWEKGKVTAEAAIHLLNQYDSPEDLIVAYRNLALISMLFKDGETQRYVAQAGYELAHKLGNRSQEAYCLLQLNFAAIRLKDDIDVALHTVRQARVIFEDLDDQWGLMASNLAEAGIAFQVGDYEQAKKWLLQSLAIGHAFGTTYYIASFVLYLGITALHQENYVQAWELLSQSLRAFWDAGYSHFAHAPLIRLAQLLLHAGKAEAAVEILALTDRYPAYHGHGALFELSPEGFEKFRKELETSLGLDRFAATWTRGAQRELNHAVAELLSQDVDKLTL